MNNYTVVVDKSTVPVGTAPKVRAAIAGETTQPFSVVSNPEFLKQGAAIEDFMKPDRVVIGVEDDDERAADADEGALRAVHAHRRADPDDGHGERRAVQVRGELDSRDAHLVHERDRQRLRAGRRRRRPGAQGDRLRPAHRHVVPVSRRRLRRQLLSRRTCRRCCKSATDKGYDFKILRAVEEVNDAQKQRLVDKMEQHFGDLKGRTIAVWGLAFKPRTDDMREAPAIPIIERLLARGATVQAYDPEAAPMARADLRRSHHAVREELRRAGRRRRAGDRHRMERVPRAGLRARCESLLKAPVVFDGRNIYSPEHMRALGFTYFSIGR